MPIVSCTLDISQLVSKWKTVLTKAKSATGSRIHEIRKQLKIETWY